jgi:hypothetical protein
MQHLLHTPEARRRKRRIRQLGITARFPPCGWIMLRHTWHDLMAQTRTVLQKGDQLPSLLPDGLFPTVPFPSPLGLILPLQEMREQHFQPKTQFALFTAPHALNLLRQVLIVEFLPFPRAQ